MEKKKEKLIETALKRFKTAVDAESHNRIEMIEDLQFANGMNQWSQEQEKERKVDGRPCLTVNLMPKFIDQVVGDMRHNRARIKVRSEGKDSDANVALIKEGLIRDIEYRSNAEFIYDSAGTMMVTCGYGAWRILTRYKNETSFEQDIYMELVPNPFCMYIDPSAKTPLEAQWGFVFEKMKKKDFEDRYPDVNIPSDMAFENMKGLSYEGWYDKETITVADYYYKSVEEEEIAQLADGTIMKKSEVPEGVEVVKTRTAKIEKVKYCKITAFDVIEEKDWVGKYIPLVPVYGKELNIEGKRHIRGLIRFAKDPQRMFNYWKTVGAETIALAPKAPWLGTVEQFEGLESEWRDANRRNLAVLRYRHINGVPLPQRVSPGGVPAGIFTEAQTAENDIKSTTGVTSAALGERSNEKSGRAIIARAQESDTSNFAYIDNLSRAIKYSGKIILDLIPKIHDTEQVLKVRGEDDSERFMPVNTTVGGAMSLIMNNPAYQQGFDMVGLRRKFAQYGANAPFNDLNTGDYGVVIETGPSYSTQRLEAADNLMKLINSVPDIAKFSGDLLVKNMDFDGAPELSKRLRKLLPPGIVEPNPNEPPMPPPPPNPEIILEMEKIKLEHEKLAVKREELAQKGNDFEERVQKIVFNMLNHLHAPQQPSLPQEGENTPQNGSMPQ